MGDFKNLVNKKKENRFYRCCLGDKMKILVTFTDFVNELKLFDSTIEHKNLLQNFQKSLSRNKSDSSQSDAIRKIPNRWPIQ